MNWKQELKTKKLQWLEKTNPAFFTMSGGYSMKVPPYKDDTANNLTRSIIAWINYTNSPRGTATRITNTGTMRKVGGDLKWTKGNSRKGIADIHAVIDGKHCSIEVKVGRDRMSEHQFREKERIESAGGLYMIASDMPGFVSWYDQQFSNGSGVLNRIRENMGCEK